MKRSLKEFTKSSWPTIEPGREFYDNWHIDAISEHLQAVVEGDIKRLIINIPPRHMKSISVAVALPAWTWTIQPEKRFLFASYASSLSVRDSVKCRRLISSQWYQNHFGVQLHILQVSINDPNHHSPPLVCGQNALTKKHYQTLRGHWVHMPQQGNCSNAQCRKVGESCELNGGFHGRVMICPTLNM